MRAEVLLLKCKFLNKDAPQIDKKLNLWYLINKIGDANIIIINVYKLIDKIDH